MSDRRIIIIGSGLGGLTCSAILAKNGYDVTVLEQGRQVGGCLQCFRRNGAKFETGMHFIGSAAPGQTLHRLMRYLEIADDVQLSPLDPLGYDVVALGGRRYRMANGRETFIDGLCRDFPDQRANLNRYFDLVEVVANASSLHSLRYAETDDMLPTEYMLRSIDDVVDSVITNPLLAKVLVGNLPLYAAQRGKTAFATHAFIADFYNQSAFRVAGGSDAIAHALQRTIERHGGRVITGCRATRIVCNDRQATAVDTDSQGTLPTDFVISDAHPMRTLELTDSKLIRPAFRQRVARIPQTVGCFTLYLHFKPGTMPYMNYNYYGFDRGTPWDCELYTPDDWPRGFLYMHMCHEPQPVHAQAGVVLSYMRFDDVAPWADTRVGRRGPAYEDFKRRKAEALLAALERHFPGTTSSVAHVYTSTPLTYRDYTGTERGSMYGIDRDITLGPSCRVSHRLRVPNVYQTGQNINSHGMLGVLVGTIVTCSEFLSAQAIYQQIMEANT